MIDEVIERLKAEVPFLNRRVHGALEFAQLFRDKKMPPHANAYVTPLAMRGATADAATGIHRQSLEYRVGVYLVINIADQTGRNALENLPTNLLAIVEKLAGWAPGPSQELGEFSSGKLISFVEGRAVYELVFKFSDQLRVTHEN